MSSDHLSRGNLLALQGRFEEAEAYFRQAIAHEPDDAAPYAELAQCLLQQEGRKKEALETIDRCIQLEPEIGLFHARRSIILSRLNRDREALESAERAIVLEPEHSFNYAVKAQALAGLQRWAEAEDQCRQALALDSDNGYAANLLASVLRLQGKKQESRLAADGLLADDPEDPYAHTNAGWAALQNHDHRTAENHFREALRLDPDFEPARSGLLQSFKARSWFYRAYLRYCFFMQRFTRAAQWGIVIGLLILFNFGNFLLEKIHPLASLALVLAYLAFVLWIILASGIGNFLVMLDQSARHALKRGEAWQGIFVGGGLFGGIAICVGSVIGSYPPGLVLGGALIVGAVPASLTFGNESKKGRQIFGGILTFVYLAGGGVFLAEALRHPAEEFTRASTVLIEFGLLAGVLCTWIGNLPSLRRDDSG